MNDLVTSLCSSLEEHKVKSLILDYINDQFNKNSPELQACFVNTMDPPKKIIHSPGFYCTQNYKEEARFFQLVEKVYDHPNAIGLANVSLLTWVEVKTKLPMVLLDHIARAKEISNEIHRENQ